MPWYDHDSYVLTRYAEFHFRPIIQPFPFNEYPNVKSLCIGVIKNPLAWIYAIAAIYSSTPAGWLLHPKPNSKTNFVQLRRGCSGNELLCQANGAMMETEGLTAVLSKPNGHRAAARRKSVGRTRVSASDLMDGAQDEDLIDWPVIDSPNEFTNAPNPCRFC